MTADPFDTSRDLDVSGTNLWHMGGRHFRLATAAVFIGAASFAVGMAVAVITSHPLW